MSYEKQRAALEKLFGEADSNESFSEIDSDTSSEPFQDDGEFADDPSYNPDKSSSTLSSTINEGEHLESARKKTDSAKQVTLDTTEENAEDIEDNEDTWTSDTESIPDFLFDTSQCGIKIPLPPNPSPIEVFSKLWTPEITTTFVECTNEYGQKLFQNMGSRTRSCRFKSFENTNKSEMEKFFGICILQGQMKFPTIRKMFSKDPLYHHPILPSLMSGRRFEQLLRCFVEI